MGEGQASGAAEAQADASTRAVDQGYRLDIQGLRAIAVLSVVIYHADHSLLGGGFVGVDIFFVISGYLITGILRRELEQKRYSIAQFYRRRVRRIFPALFLMLAVTAALGWFLLEPDELREFGQTLVSAAFLVSNFDFLALSGYFDRAAALKPLLHTWSLAVEEQFYLVFPLLLALLWRGGLRFTQAALAVLLIASVGLSIWLTAVNEPAAFFLAPPRAFELLMGALLALGAIPTITSTIWRDHISIAGLALIILSLALINDDLPFPGAIALAPCLGAAMMLHAGETAPSRAGRWISSAPFVFFGTISYALYLWHWPLLVYLRQIVGGPPTPLLAGAAMLVALALAYISTRFVERPILARKARVSHVLWAGAASMIAAGAAGAVLFVGGGFPQRFSPQALSYFDSAQDYNQHRECFQQLYTFLPYAQNCTWGAHVAPSAVVWGDSFAAELAVAVGERLGAHGQSALETSASRCPPAPGYTPRHVPPCFARNQETLRHLAADPRIRDVIMIADLAAHRHEEAVQLEAGYRRAVATLLAAGKHVILIEQVPVMPSDAPTALGWIATRGGDPRSFGTSRADHERRSAWANQLARSFAGVTIVDPASVLCDANMCRAVDASGRTSLYWDREHISLAGARLLAARIPLS